MSEQQDNSVDRTVPVAMAPAVDGSRTVISMTNMEGSTITMSRRHGEFTIAEVSILTIAGNQASFKLNRPNRRRMRALLDMMDLCDAE
jgi:hypothetical protein